MLKITATLLTFLAFAPVSLAVYCYVGEQSVAELQPMFDLCASVLDLKTYKIRYTGIRNNGEKITFGEEDFGLSKTHCFPMVETMELTCYCSTSMCNKMLNVGEFVTKLPIDF